MFDMVLIKSAIVSLVARFVKERDRNGDWIIAPFYTRGDNEWPYARIRGTAHKKRGAAIIRPPLFFCVC